jgi:fumarylacetoacetate (FAA) hydrolase family protein
LQLADIQNIKAAGVTFVRSMVERVIEEQAKGYLIIFLNSNWKGEASKADELRKHFTKDVGASLSSIVPGHCIIFAFIYSPKAL